MGRRTDTTTIGDIADLECAVLNFLNAGGTLREVLEVVIELGLPPSEEEKREWARRTAEYEEQLR
jgi:hypothetical protein